MNTPRPKSIERSVSTPSGWLMLFVVIIAFVGIVLWTYLNATSRQPSAIQIVGAIFGLAILVIMIKGFFTLQPNEANVLLLFGAYRGKLQRVCDDPE